MSPPFSLRHRFLQPADFTDALDLLPAWLPLSAAQREALPALWRRLLLEPGFNADVIEDLAAPPGQRLLAMGMAIALDDGWARRLRGGDAPPGVARHVYADLLAGRLRLPDDATLARLNGGEGDGVAFLVLHYQQRHMAFDDPRTMSLLSVAMSAFRHAHAGHRIGVLWQEAWGPEQDVMRSMGHREQPTALAPGGADGPRLFGLTRAEALAMLPGSHLRDVFEHRAPRCFFSAAERRLLRRAVGDESDEEIAALLDISIHTVKKLWAAVYARAARQMPELLGDAPAAAVEGVRGPEKRRSLIGYLRQHPEELRPHVVGVAGGVAARRG
ncbi:helix-turn-helix transcriptional regulator [Aquabacterium sp. J223]|uniref:helix-turn-helix transcriptional regulator n=1 Tax=Aquabacterium sp. J223 TaxID=2898431 RepID=UPI0021ADA3B0|nr:helix-turn-helix transcriptional regulator [Aquabacterium sp. J223]UUX96342.1 helix-turn-helix transcriptional regulator [Aquabacterium sp. J223]